MMLQVQDITTFYGEALAIDKVSFDVAPRQICSIIGANGAGKSTILKTVSGVLSPKYGTIHFLDRRIDGLPAHQIVGMGIAHIQEGHRAFKKLTVRENLVLSAYTVRDKKRIEKTLDWVYELFPILRERSGRNAETLSGGQQQMLVIASGLMSLPKLLIIDEPSVGLMPKYVSVIFKIIHQIREEGIAVLLVEQNVQRTLETCDYAYVLESGRIVASGSGRDILESNLVRKAYLGI